MTDTTTTPPETVTPVATEDRRHRLSGWWQERDRRELALWAGLVVVAAILRFWDLGARPFHHDESQDAYFSTSVHISFDDHSTTPSFEYNPLLHGPLRFYLNKLVFAVFGESDFTARLIYVLAGIAIVALPYLLRRQLGRVAALSAGGILAVSPSILYYSRFAREDILLAAVALLFTVVAFRYLRRPHTLKLCLLLALVSIAFAIKESGLVMAAIAGGFFLTAGVVQSLRADDWRDGEIVRAVTAVGWTGWVYAISTMIVVYAALFTVFFTHTHCMTTAYAGSPTHPANCLEGVVYGINYWRAQQHVARGDDLAWLYYSILVGPEWPILLTAAVGVVFSFLRPTTLKLYLVWTTVFTLAFICWGRERFPWLIVHPLVPMILLSGVGIQGLWSLRSRPARTGAMVAVGLGAVYLVLASFSANAKHPVDPENMLVSTQSSKQVKQVTDQVHALDAKRKAKGQPQLSITVDSSEGATFPYAWYFRDDDHDFIDMTQANYTPTSQVLIMTETSHNTQRPNLAGVYDCRRFDFRIWWVKKPYAQKFSPSAWWDWWTKLETWTPTGGMKEFFCLRRDAGALPGQGTPSEIPTPPPVS